MPNIGAGAAPKRLFAGAGAAPKAGTAAGVPKEETCPGAGAAPKAGAGAGVANETEGWLPNAGGAVPNKVLAGADPKSALAPSWPPKVDAGVEKPLAPPFIGVNGVTTVGPPPNCAGVEKPPPLGRNGVLAPKIPAIISRVC